MALTEVEKQDIVDKFMEHKLPINNGELHNLEVRRILIDGYERSYKIEKALRDGNFKIALPGARGGKEYIDAGVYWQKMENRGKITWKKIGFGIAAFTAITTALISALTLAKMFGILK